jgi:phage shock protein A
MSWIEQFSLVMRSNITVLRERFEDPERMLHQLLIDMEEELEGIRHSVAEALADEIQLRKQADAARHEAEQWLTRAKSAIDRKDNASAEAALDQKLLASERADSLTQEYNRQQVETSKLRDSVRKLEENIRQARQRRTLLLARMTRATSTRRINAALERAQGTSAFAEFSRLETKVDRAEAIAEAYDRMDGKDPAAEELERAFAQQERAEKLKRELESLRQQINPTTQQP